MPRVKSALVPLAFFSLAACATSSNHRDLWWPDKQHGPYTDELRNMTLADRSDHRSRTVHMTVVRQPGQPAASPAPALGAGVLPAGGPAPASVPAPPLP